MNPNRDNIRVPKKDKQRAIKSAVLSLLVVLIRRVLGCSKKLPELHIYSLFLSILFWSYFGIMVYCCYSGSAMQQVSVYALTSYVFLIWESFVDRTYQQIQHIYQGKSGIEYVENIKSKTPRIGWSCRGITPKKSIKSASQFYKAYQLEDAYSVPHVKNQNWWQADNQTSRTFCYQNSEDVSEVPVSNVLSSPILRIRCDMRLEFCDETVRYRYDDERDDFLCENGKRNLKIHWWNWINISGYHRDLILCASPGKSPILLGKKQYILFSLLGFPWFYRIWLETISTSAYVCFKKKIF